MCLQPPTEAKKGQAIAPGRQSCLPGTRTGNEREQGHTERQASSHTVYGALKALPFKDLPAGSEASPRRPVPHLENSSRGPPPPGYPLGLDASSVWGRAASHSWSCLSAPTSDAETIHNQISREIVKNRFLFTAKLLWHGSCILGKGKMFLRRPTLCSSYP